MTAGCTVCGRSWTTTVIAPEQICPECSTWARARRAALTADSIVAHLQAHPELAVEVVGRLKVANMWTDGGGDGYRYSVQGSIVARVTENTGERPGPNRWWWDLGKIRGLPGGEGLIATEAEARAAADAALRAEGWALAGGS